MVECGHILDDRGGGLDPGFAAGADARDHRLAPPPAVGQRADAVGPIVVKRPHQEAGAERAAPGVDGAFAAVEERVYHRPCQRGGFGRMVAVRGLHPQQPAAQGLLAPETPVEPGDQILQGHFTALVDQSFEVEERIDHVRDTDALHLGEVIPGAALAHVHPPVDAVVDDRRKEGRRAVAPRKGVRGVVRAGHQFEEGRNLPVIGIEQLLESVEPGGTARCRPEPLPGLRIDPIVQRQFETLGQVEEIADPGVAAALDTELDASAGHHLGGILRIDAGVHHRPDGGRVAVHSRLAESLGRQFHHLAKERAVDLRMPAHREAGHQAAEFVHQFQADIGQLIDGVVAVAVAAANGQIQYLEPGELIELDPEAGHQFNQALPREPGVAVGLPVRPQVLVEPSQRELTSTLAVFHAFEQIAEPRQLNGFPQGSRGFVGDAATGTRNRLQLRAPDGIRCVGRLFRGQAGVALDKMRGRAQGDGHRLALDPLRFCFVVAASLDAAQHAVHAFGQQAAEMGGQVISLVAAAENACAQGLPFLGQPERVLVGHQRDILRRVRRPVRQRVQADDQFTRLNFDGHVAQQVVQGQGQSHSRWLTLARPQRLAPPDTAHPEASAPLFRLCKQLFDTRCHGQASSLSPLNARAISAPSGGQPGTWA